MNIIRERDVFLNIGKLMNAGSGPVVEPDRRLRVGNLRVRSEPRRESSLKMLERWRGQIDAPAVFILKH